MFPCTTERNFSVIQKSDEILAGHVEQVRCLLGCQFATNRHDRDRITLSHDVDHLLEQIEDGSRQRNRFTLWSTKLATRRRWHCVRSRIQYFS